MLERDDIEKSIPPVGTGTVLAPAVLPSESPGERHLANIEANRNAPDPVDQEIADLRKQLGLLQE